MGEAVKTVALELQPCCGKRSGVGVYTYELAKRLHGDEQLRFCGNVFNFCGRNDTRGDLRGIDMPVRVNRLLPYGVYRRIWNGLPLGYERFFPGQTDLSLFFNYIVPPHIGGKVMTVVYDMTCLRFPETMDKRNRRRLDEGLVRSAERSDRIVTISEFSKREIGELLHFPEDRIAVIPCAPGISPECAPWEELQARFALKKPFLLYVGTREPRKNLPRLVRAFEILKEREHIPHSLVLAGGAGWNNRELDSVLAASSWKEDIRLTGYVTEGEKNGLYRHADAFVFPSLYEGFGIPPLEAMHFGCPVICSDAASLPETAGEAAEYVDPLDEESMAHGIRRILTDEKRRGELIRRGQIREREYTWEASAQRLMDLCREVLDEK